MLFHPHLLTGLFVLSLLTPATGLFAANTHTASLPAGITPLPDASEKRFLYLEGETAAEAEAKGDTFSNPAHAAATVFADIRQPDDRWWATVVGHEGSRFAMRGADQNQPAHQWIWRDLGGRLQPGIYDLFVRGHVSPGGNHHYRFFAAEDAGSLTGAEPLGPVTTEQDGIRWHRLGSVQVTADTSAFRLEVTTTKSSVQLDTVLLIDAEHADREVSLKRLPGEEDWRGQRGVVFARESGSVTFGLEPVVAGAQARIHLRDEAGRPLPAQTPALEQGRFTIQLPTPGHYQIQAEVTLRNGKVLSDHLSAAVLGAPIDEAKRNRSRFGLWHVQGERELVRLAGGRWNRQMTSFRNVTEEAVRELADSPRATPENRLGELDQIGVFSFGLPMWLMDLPADIRMPSYGHPFGVPTDWEKLEEVIATYARQRTMPDLIEMYNEPLPAWRGTEAELVRFARTVRAGLQRVDPAFRLLGPCLYSIHMGELERLAQHGLLEAIDGLSMHAYVNGSPPEEEFHARLIDLRRFRDQRAPGMPLYVTEFGWTSSAGTWQQPVDEITQARYTTRSLLLGMNEDIEALVYFCLQYNTRNTGEAAFSLIDLDGRPRPAYTAFATIAKWFAAAQPVGHWQLAPTTHLVLAREGERVLGAVWDTRTEHKPWQPPFPITEAIGFTGRPIQPDAQGHYPVGLDPIFFVADAPTLPAIRTEPLRTETHGLNALNASTGPTPADPTAAALVPGADAEPGLYTFLQEREGTWTAHPVELQQPVRFLEVAPRWPSAAQPPKVRVVLRSYLEDRTLPMSVALGESAPRSLKLPPRGIRQAVLPLAAAQPGQRQPIAITARSGDTELDLTLQQNLEATFVAAAEVPAGESGWNALAPAVDFSAWGPFPREAEITAADLQGAMRAGWNDQGFYLQVDVTDDEHIQVYASADPGHMWAQDSIQIGFDLDTLRPWRAGIVGDGLAGHRVFEFTVAGPGNPADSAAVFRHRSYLDGLPAHTVATGVQAQVQRAGDQTRYRVFFPWSELAATAPPEDGVLGFALVVNDVDPAAGRRRHGLQLFGGIAQSKDATEFGHLWLHPAP